MIKRLLSRRPGERHRDWEDRMCLYVAMVIMTFSVSSVVLTVWLLPAVPDQIHRPNVNGAAKHQALGWIAERLRD